MVLLGVDEILANEEPELRSLAQEIRPVIWKAVAMARSS
jgi:hypothetical protein